MKQVTRMKTRDVAFPFRMGAGFSGDVNRTHPASIEPCLSDASAPPASFGQAVLIDPTPQGARPFTTGDASQAAYGVTVRPYPFQQSSGNNYGAAAIGGATPPAGVIDVLRSGYIMVQVNLGQTAPVKNGAVYVRVAATSGNHIIGQFETAADGTNNVLVTNANFQGGMDASGVAEIFITPAN